MTSTNTNAAVQPSTFASDLLLQSARAIRQSHRTTDPAFYAVCSLAGAVDCLQQAAELLAKGAPADAPEVAQFLDFAVRKVRQGGEELQGRTFDL